jgi:alkyldihydroxyacetonephosphate synthase
LPDRRSGNVLDNIRFSTIMSRRVALSTIAETAMPEGRRKHYGWGREGEGFTPDEKDFAFARLRERLGVDGFDQRPVPPLDAIALTPPRLTPPASLARLCTSTPHERASHTYGKSYPDYVRGLAGDYTVAPDVVAYPRTAADVAALLDWAGGAQAAVTPFGGGSSVCGGVEPRLDGGRYKAAITIDTAQMVPSSRSTARRARR